MSADEQAVAAANQHYNNAAEFLDAISSVTTWERIRAIYDTDDAALGHLARVGTLMGGWEGEEAHQFAYEGYARNLPSDGAA